MAPYLPQQNGHAEHWNQTIVEQICAMLLTSGLTNGFGEYALIIALYVYNCTPIKRH